MTWFTKNNNNNKNKSMICSVFPGTHLPQKRRPTRNSQNPKGGLGHSRVGHTVPLPKLWNFLKHFRILSEEFVGVGRKIIPGKIFGQILSEESRIVSVCLWKMISYLKIEWLFSKMVFDALIEFMPKSFFLLTSVSACLCFYICSKKNVWNL